MKIKILKITWRDSNIYNLQEESGTNFGLEIIESVGFLVEEKKNFVVITRDKICEDVRGTLVIPKENIIKKEIIKCL